MIEASGLSKKFTTSYVVSEVNLKIAEGEIVGLLGPNGAGKTTTLRMMAGVLPPTKGVVEINGKDIHKVDTIKIQVGFLPENNPLFEEMTVEEFLQFWSRIKGIEGDEKKEAIDFVVNNCGIAEVYYRPIAELSKGYRQRVGLSQAILTRPEILILDEPTEGLDPNQRHDISLLIKSLAKKRTVIISSHVLSEIAKIANRLIVIHKGKIIADDTPENYKHMGSKSTTIFTEIKGIKVLPALRAIKGVSEVREAGSNSFELSVTGKNDIREDIFDLAVHNKWKLLTLMEKGRDIDEVFNQLTKE